MNIHRIRILLTCCILFATSGTYAGLITNGSFEENPVRKGGWMWFKATDVNGWMGSNIEIWHKLNGLGAVDGSQHIELNSHGSNTGSFSIYQDFATIGGQPYTLNFHYRARRNTQEAFKVELFSAPDILFRSTIIDDHLTTTWNLHTSSFRAVSNTMRLQFTSIAPLMATVGNLIDNVSVSPQSQAYRSVDVPEPSTLGLFAFVIIGLIVMARKQSTKD
jgi:hypothetical protein